MQPRNIMTRATSPSWIIYGALLSVCGCGAEPGEVSSELRSALDASDASSCATAAAAAGWLNSPTPVSSGLFTASWVSWPSDQGSPGAGPIDAVIGLSHGSADRFIDLGPIVRFGPQGYIDVRNAEIYSGRAFPYTFGDGPYEFQLRVDVPARHYSAWVRHLDSPFKPFELIATDFAFRTEQSSVTQLDNLAAIVDSSHGTVQNCGFSKDPPSGCVASAAGAWRSRAFTLLGAERAQLDFFAWVTTVDMDVVVGASNGPPTRFNQLAAIVRFRPDGRMDARNGAAYAADVEFKYGPGTYYRITLDIDLTRKTYSVYVTPWGEFSTTRLARDYAFRSEQAGVANLDHLGQFVDGTAGSANTCALVAR
jgi:hypothetical protein